MKKIFPLSSSLVLVLALLLSSCGKEAAPVVVPEKEGKVIQTGIVGESLFSEQVYVTGKVSPVREITLSTQATGFIWSVSVGIGDSVAAGEMLASINDTYGTAGNGLQDALIGIESAKLSQENTVATIDQALENARLSYEKAQKDYDASLISVDASATTKSKAQLDLDNYITSQQKTLESYEATYTNQVQNFQSFITNVIDTTDTFLGVSQEKQNLNDSYEYLISALDSSKKTVAEDSLRKLLVYKNWIPDQKLPLIDRVKELQRVYLLVNDVLANTETVLIKSITDSSVFTPTTLATLRATIDGYQTQYSSISSGLVSFINTAQTFLATYEKEREAREQTAAIAEGNAKTAYDIAKNAYETAKKTHDIALRQIDQSLASADIKYANAQGGLSRLVIMAPFTGVITAKNTDTGALVSPGLSLFTLADVSSMIVKTEISVDKQKELVVGQEMPLLIHWERVVGRLKSLSAGPDPVSRLYKAEISLPRVHPDVSLGDYVDIVITRENDEDEQQKDIVVPFSALKNLGQETYAVYVFVPDEKKPTTGIVRERVVKIGATNENSVTITEGLNLGETIVTLWTLNVEDGDYVEEAGSPG